MGSRALGGTVRIRAAAGRHPKVPAGWNIAARRSLTRRCYRAGRVRCQGIPRRPASDAGWRSCLTRSASRRAAMISAAWSGAFASAARRWLAPGPWVKRCRTLLPPPGSGSIRYRHNEDGRAGSPRSSRTTHVNAGPVRLGDHAGHLIFEAIREPVVPGEPGAGPRLAELPEPGRPDAFRAPPATQVTSATRSHTSPGRAATTCRRPSNRWSPRRRSGRRRCSGTRSCLPSPLPTILLWPRALARGALWWPMAERPSGRGGG